MIVWALLLGLSGLTGLLSALYLDKPWAIYVAGGLPWFALLAAILYTEYFMPYQGGGASMWPIAQLFGGTIAAVTGIFVYKLTKNTFQKGKKND